MVNHRYSTLGRILSLFGCLLLVAAWSSSALAAGYPQTGKSIQMLVGYAAGGPSDVGARVLASGLEKELGVSVMTVNKPGANGQIAFSPNRTAMPLRLPISPLPLQVISIRSGRRSTTERALNRSPCRSMIQTSSL
jgi:tripartite-type tricarboxylate transporter receptor subunit TctC